MCDYSFWKVFAELSTWDIKNFVIQYTDIQMMINYATCSLNINLHFVIKFEFSAASEILKFTFSLY